MGGDAGELGGHDAVGDHAVGVAEGGDGDFDEEVVRAESGGSGGGDLVDCVGFFELGGEGQGQRLGLRGGGGFIGRTSVSCCSTY